MIEDSILFEQALRLHQRLLVADAHCDTIAELYNNDRSLAERSAEGHSDLPRLREGAVNLQFFAAFIAPAYRQQGLLRAVQLIDCLQREIAVNQRDITLVRSYRDIELAWQQQRIAALLTIEGGEALQGELAALRILYQLGVRGLTLTWNGRNELADGVAEKQSGGGLTAFGRQVVQEMERLGMLIDVSHLAPAGFRDVVSIVQGPVIASHSNAAALCAHPRNLDDWQLKAVAAGGGVVGVTFVPDFLGVKADLESVLEQIDYLVQLIGAEHVCLGSDFDGITETPVGLNDVTAYPQLTCGLLRRGYSVAAVADVMGRNLLRVIKTVLG